MNKIWFALQIVMKEESNPFIPRHSGGNPSALAFMFVVVVLILVIGYGIAKTVWGEG